jgi:hypothetical protein
MIFNLIFGVLDWSNPNKITRQTRTKIIHEGYDRVTAKDDIGLLQWTEPLILSRMYKSFNNM